MYLVISYLHIDGVKYRIYLRKTQTTTSITIQKITERIDPNITL